MGENRESRALTRDGANTNSGFLMSINVTTDSGPGLPTAGGLQRATMHNVSKHGLGHI